MDQSPNLELPYISPAQAQKHVTHNEALQILDVVIAIPTMLVRSQWPTTENVMCVYSVNVALQIQNGVDYTIA